MTQLFAMILMCMVSQMSVAFEASEMKVICQKYKYNMVVCCGLQHWVVSVCCHEKDNFLSSVKWYIFSFRSVLQFVYKWCLLLSIQLHN